jgi:hypothetical protein
LNFEEHAASFRAAAIAHCNSTATGDHKRANAEFDRMIVALKNLRQASDRGRSILTRMLSDTELSVRSCAATYLLPLDEVSAIPVLEEAAQRSDPLNGMTAIVVLREWRCGRLKIP